MDRVISGYVLATDAWEHKTRRKGTSKRRGMKTVAFTLLVISILIASSVLFVSSRLWVVNLGYRISQALKEQRELLETGDRLGIERAVLINPERIDRYGREKLRMRHPREDQMRFVR